MMSLVDYRRSTTDNRASAEAEPHRGKSAAEQQAPLGFMVLELPVNFTKQEVRIIIVNGTKSIIPVKRRF